MTPDTTTILEQLIWHKAAITLRNERNRYAREHPFFTLQAICNHAAAKAGIERESFFYHPLNHLPDRIHKGEVYTLELVAPGDHADKLERIIDGLATHLENGEGNFTLQARETARRRNVAILAAEHPSTPEQEICLDFLTPLPYVPKNPERNWLIDPTQFIRLLTNRINRYYKTNLEEHAFPCDEIRLLPYYWSLERHSHASKSNQGRQEASGMTGPLYIRGNIEPLWPLLLACSELHCGRRAANGQGHYRLIAERSYFDMQLGNYDKFTSVIEEIEQGSDIATEISETVLDKPRFLADLHQRLLAGNPPDQPADGHWLGKRRGGRRLVATLATEDYLIHKYLHRIMSPVLDRMFEEASVGFRPGRSRHEASAMIRQAREEGYGHVLESDVASFFDEIDWKLMDAKIDAHLPLADQTTRQLLAAAARTAIRIDQESIPRDKGLLQGSPLSPLLANLYLDSFDEEMAQRGFRLIRFADDFVIMTRSGEEAAHALAVIKESLATLKLTHKEDKTRFGPVDQGFTFLGLSFGAGLDEAYVQDSAKARTLFITNRFLFVGIDHDAVVIRKDKKLLDRFPLRQLAEIIILGNNNLSTRLLQRCTTARIPVSFCSPMGYYYTTLRPDSKKHFTLAACHQQRHAALSETEQVRMAAQVVIAKLHNYLAWFRESWPTETRSQGVRAALESHIASAAKAETLDVIRGYEGAAAKVVFRFVNDRLNDRFFHSRGRRKRCQEDPWNSLLDFAYSLLFTRINVLLRSRGLNPYLGVLHSHRDNYESLVCDLQEPFRCRMDRFVVRLCNLGVIKEAGFATDGYGRQRLSGPTLGLFLQHFEREMITRLGRDGGTLQQLLTAQVHAVQQWAEQREEVLRFHLTGNGKQ